MRDLAANMLVPGGLSEGKLNYTLEAIHPFVPVLLSLNFLKRSNCVAVLGHLRGKSSRIQLRAYTSSYMRLTSRIQGQNDSEIRLRFAYI